MNELQLRHIVLEALRAECNCLADEGEDDIYMWGPSIEAEYIARAIENGDIRLVISEGALL